MGNSKKIENILDFAIRNEEEAYQYYTDLAKLQQHEEIKKAYEGFAAEELGHKKKLEEARKGNLQIFSANKVETLNISEYLVDVEPSPDMSYQEALVIAMKREKMAFKLYTDLAAITTDSDAKTMFKVLAREEAEHKLRFELEYDEKIYQED